MLAATPRLATLPPTTLAGQRQSMSLQADATAGLWQQTQRQLRQLGWPVAAARYSVRVYQPGYFERFSPAACFEKWAAAALAPGATAPAGLELLVLPEGLYAVFDYQGPASAAPAVFGYILGEWLPGSGYQLADRPHLEVLPPGYRPTDPAGREEIWVPIELFA